MKFLRIVPKPEALAWMNEAQRAEIEAHAREMTAAVNRLVEQGACTIEVEELQAS